MTTGTTCECGKAIPSDGGPGSIVRCPACGRKNVVGEAWAAQAAPVQAVSPEGPGEKDGGVLVVEEPSVGEALLARAMPWVISVFLHTGVALVLLLVTAFVIRPSPAPTDCPLCPTTLGPNIGPGPGNVKFEGESPRPRAGPVNLKPGGNDPLGGQSPIREGAIPSSLTNTGKKPPSLGDIIGVSGGLLQGSLASGRVDFFGHGIGRGPRGTNGGQGGGADGDDPKGSTGPGGVGNIVFVVDRSGSMVDTFDRVRYEMLISISRLTDKHRFHVILFAQGAPMENPPRRLVAGEKSAKIEAAKFLETVLPGGQTDPVPALQRAFEVLKQADPRKGKGIFLLTDGVFPDNPRVLETISHLNADKSVGINTYLYGNRPPEAEKVLRRIALDNRGNYKYISPNE